MDVRAGDAGMYVGIFDHDSHTLAVGPSARGGGGDALMCTCPCIWYVVSHTRRVLHVVVGYVCVPAGVGMAIKRIEQSEGVRVLLLRASPFGVSVFVACTAFHGFLTYFNRRAFTQTGRLANNFSLFVFLSGSAVVSVGGNDYP